MSKSIQRFGDMLDLSLPWALRIRLQAEKPTNESLSHEITQRLVNCLLALGWELKYFNVFLLLLVLFMVVSTLIDA